MPFVLTNGDTVAQSSSALLDRTFTDLLVESSISVTQDGTTQASGLAWTGTSTDGDSTDADCSDWTDGTTGSSGTYGQTGNVNGVWTDRELLDAFAFCDFERALYCFSDAPLPRSSLNL